MHTKSDGARQLERGSQVLCRHTEHIGMYRQLERGSWSEAAVASETGPPVVNLPEIIGERVCKTDRRPRGLCYRVIR
jgi:hypothetical protein